MNSVSVLYRQYLHTVVANISTDGAKRNLSSCCCCRYISTLSSVIAQRNSVLSFPAPTPPRMFQITSVMTTSLSFSWQTPVTPNGVLIGYQLFCQPLLSSISLPQVLNPGPTAVMVMLSGLYPGVGYNCSIVARNSAGPSGPVYINGSTLETGMYIRTCILSFSVLLFFKLHVLQAFVEECIFVFLYLVTRCFCFGEKVMCYFGRAMLSGIPFCTGNTLTLLAEYWVYDDQGL